MHDWTRVEPTIFHHVHQQWTVAIASALNSGILPAGLSALIEQHASGLVPDVLTVERRRPERMNGGLATIPQTRMRIEPRTSTWLRRANRVTIRHRLGEVVCIIEIVSPGKKAGDSAIRSFVAKTHEFLRAGANVLLIDPFPPGAPDPHSLHKLVWDEIEDVPFEMPADEPLLLASYQAGNDRVGLPPVAYLEPFRVGTAMPDMPAWVDPDRYVPVPLERTYQSS